MDGSSNSKGCGLGIVLTLPREDVLQRSIKCGFKATNNEAEYEALIVGLDLAVGMGIQRLIVTTDSQLIALQVSGAYQARDIRMSSYLSLVQQKFAKFSEVTVQQVPRLENSHTDALANLVSAVQTTSDISIPVVYMA